MPRSRAGSRTAGGGGGKRDTAKDIILGMECVYFPLPRRNQCIDRSTGHLVMVHVRRARDARIKLPIPIRCDEFPLFQSSTFAPLCFEPNCFSLSSTLSCILLSSLLQSLSSHRGFDNGSSQQVPTVLFVLCIFLRSFALYAHLPILNVALPNYAIITETARSCLPGLSTETIGASILIDFLWVPFVHFLRPFHTHSHRSTAVGTACASGAATTAARTRSGDGSGDRAAAKPTADAAAPKPRDARQRAGEYAHCPTRTHFTHGTPTM